jgi:hypothetical protein
MSVSKTNTDFFLRIAGKPAPQTSGWNQSLTVAVEAAVEEIDENALSPPSGWGQFSVLDAKRLLALLSWCYARELYSSAEIHMRLRRGTTAELWDGGVPEATDIARFRMENRRVLQSCLQVALRFLAAKKVVEGMVTRINEAYIAAEAARRIIAAIFIDNTAEEAMALL